MSEETLQKSETKICESCGKDFSCGANVGKCWCFEIDLNEETLARLREDFENCLCQSCLESSEIKLNEANKSSET